MDIVKAIYDMMGKYTYPVLREDTPRQHVDVFFQVSARTSCASFKPNLDQPTHKPLSKWCVSNSVLCVVENRKELQNASSSSNR